MKTLTSCALKAITREEKLELTLSAEITKKNRAFINKQTKILGIYHVVKKGDTVAVAYNFNIEYLDNIEKRLSAILALAGTEDVTVTCASVKVLNHTQSIIREIFRKFNELESITVGKKKRKAP